MNLTPQARSMDFEAFKARQSTTVVALALCLVEAGFAALEETLGSGLLFWLYLGHATTSGIVALVLWEKRNATERQSLIAFLILALPLLPIFWVAQSSAIGAGTPWSPFLGRKLLMLGLALLTPYSPRVAALLLGLFMAESIVLWHHLGLAHNATALAVGEPWVTLLYFAASLVLVVMRWRKRRLERRLLDAQAQTQALRQLVRVSISVRDQINTPLQSLEVGLKLLSMKVPREREAIMRMDRSLRTLVEMSHALQRWDDENAGSDHLEARLRDAEKLHEDLGPSHEAH